MNRRQEQLVNTNEWAWKCAERLHQQWPRVDRVDLEHLAEALLTDERWRLLEPQTAADEWLRQGIPQKSEEPQP